MPRGPDPAGVPARPPSRRRPRRSDVVRYRVQVELSGTQPALWRRLDLASDLFLDEVHDAAQACFGWTDSHLHQFGSRPRYYSPETEYYLCPDRAGRSRAGCAGRECAPGRNPAEFVARALDSIGWRLGSGGWQLSHKRFVARIRVWSRRGETKWISGQGRNWHGTIRSLRALIGLMYR